MSQKNTINFNSKIIPQKPLNEEMTLCKCYVMALGKNANHSYFSGETVDNAIPTIYNLPVIGRLFVDSENNFHMGGHDMELARDENGELCFKSLCVPFGVVPIQDNIHYETLIDKYGKEKTYLVCDIILWTGKYPDLLKAKYNNEIYFNQSMEINVKEQRELKEDKNYTEIKSFSFSALCLLGKSDEEEFNVEPCFPESKVEPYYFSLENNEFNKLMEEFKSELSKCFQYSNLEKGGRDLSMQEEVIINESETIEEVDKTLEDKKIDENTDENVSDDNLIIEDTNNENTDNTDSNNDTEEVITELDENYDSFKDVLMESLISASSNISTHDYENDIHITYSICFYDENYVYMIEYCKCKNELNSRQCRAKYSYDNCEVVSINKVEDIIFKFVTESEVEKLNNLKKEYEEYKTFYIERTKQDKEKEYDDVLSEFTDLVNNQEFSLLCENKMSFENVETLKEKCFAIRGKSTINTKKPKNKILIDYSQGEEEIYGGLFSLYPPKKNEK